MQTVKYLSGTAKLWTWNKFYYLVFLWYVSLFTIAKCHIRTFLGVLLTEKCLDQRDKQSDFIGSGSKQLEKMGPGQQIGWRISTSCSDPPLQFDCYLSEPIIFLSLHMRILEDGCLGGPTVSIFTAFFVIKLCSSRNISSSLYLWDVVFVNVPGPCLKASVPHTPLASKPWLVSVSISISIAEMLWCRNWNVL